MNFLDFKWLIGTMEDSENAFLKVRFTNLDYTEGLCMRSIWTRVHGFENESWVRPRKKLPRYFNRSYQWSYNIVKNDKIGCYNARMFNSLALFY